MSDLSLDQLYKMVAHIYREQNANRSAFATYTHFVEVCGMLTVHDRKKKQEGPTVIDALCKALGWYFPLLAKFRIESIEEVIFRKFPYACPYCRLAPHQDQRCKLVKGTNSTVDHKALREVYETNLSKKPTSLNGWQQMFKEIYPRQASDTGRSTIGLLEELGELAEAIRVHEQHPKYLLGELADTFSYLMGIANEHEIQLDIAQGDQFSLEDEFLQRYPGLCPQCGSAICVCPSVPDSTVGRMAKELEILKDENLFFDDPAAFAIEGKNASTMALERAGGYSGLAEKFPFDRGDANKALIHLCLHIASSINSTQPNIAEILQSAALRLGSEFTYSGSPEHKFDDDELLEILRDAWRHLDASEKKEIQDENELANELGTMLGKIRVLFVGASPREDDMLRVSNEFRAIDHSIQQSNRRDEIELTQINSPTIDDLRRALLKNKYDIVHLSGHGSSEEFLLHSEADDGQSISYSDLRDYLNSHKSVQCIVLNACKSAKNITEPIAPITIGMDDSILDDAAIEFSRGFYDALGEGNDIDFAINEGIGAVKLKGIELPEIVVLKA